MEGVAQGPFHGGDRRADERIPPKVRVGKKAGLFSILQDTRGRGGEGTTGVCDGTQSLFLWSPPSVRVSLCG